ncbi:MAG: carotenoid biosynthesis protein [Polyangiaceae bacterium]|nr:carotenoid biosynthesis protein [Polyangiaceae bacterium]
MVSLQIACVLIVALFLWFRAKLEAKPLHLFRRLFLLAAAAWVGENTCIRLYGFYEYSASWWLFLDKVPLLIILIWPIVIQSARDLGTCLWTGRDRPSVSKMALTAFFLVLADAALIEPISVRAGLWHWTEPGYFSVPPIGILGWAYFSALAVAVFERAQWKGKPWFEAWVLLVAPAGTHLLLLASWWGAFRWVNTTLPNWAPTILVWMVTITLTIGAIIKKTRRRVPPILLWIRLPAALFFFVLLALHAGESGFLVPYAIGFAPPYLAIFAVRFR